MIPDVNGFVDRLLRYWTVLSTFQMPRVNSQKKKKKKKMLKTECFSVNTLQIINLFSPQNIALCLMDVEISVGLSPVIGFPVVNPVGFLTVLAVCLYTLVHLLC